MQSHEYLLNITFFSGFFSSVSGCGFSVTYRKNLADYNDYIVNDFSQRHKDENTMYQNILR